MLTDINAENLVTLNGQKSIKLSAMDRFGLFATGVKPSIGLFMNRLVDSQSPIVNSVSQNPLPGMEGSFWGGALAAGCAALVGAVGYKFWKHHQPANVQPTTDLAPKAEQRLTKY